MNWLAPAGVLGLYLLTVLGLLQWARARRTTRWPFRDKLNLLRAPGEHLQRRLAEINDKVASSIAGGMLFTLIGVAAALFLASSLHLAPSATMGLAIAAAVTCSAWSGFRLVRLWRQMGRFYLGWVGERVTAEFLDPLKATGYRIFHDLPCNGSKGPFNLDHVAVGPNGIHVVETKTRRKGRASRKLREHEVAFDGEKLVWPWGEDRNSLAQAMAEAEWLGEFLRTKTGCIFPVSPILALPGWYVKETPRAGIRVINPCYIAEVIRKSGAVALTDAQIRQISSELENICRDVTV